MAAPSWRVVITGGDTHVGLVDGEGNVLEYASGPSGPTRYGRTSSAQNEARHRNRLMRDAAALANEVLLPLTRNEANAVMTALSLFAARPSTPVIDYTTRKVRVARVVERLSKELAKR